MVQNLIRVALVVGMTAVLSVAGLEAFVTALVRFVAGRYTAPTIGALVTLVVAILIIAKKRVTQRYNSPQWVWVASGVFGLAVLLAPRGFAASPYALVGTWGFLGSPVVQVVASLAVLFVLLKLANDLRPEFETPEREAGLKWRIVIGLAVFIAFNFSFIPASWLPGPNWQALGQGRFDAGPTWPFWVDWTLAFLIAYAFVTSFRIDERISSDRPGLTILQVGVVISIVGLLLGFFLKSSLSQGSTAGLVVAFLQFVVVLGPVGLLAKALVTFGALKLLFSLQPTEMSAPMSPEDSPQTKAPPQSGSTGPIAGAGTNAQPDAPIAANATDVALMANEEGLRAALEANPINPRLQDRLHRLLCVDQARTAEMLEHAKGYLAMLLSQSLREQALALYRTCAARDPNFRPPGDQVLPLARLLILQKDGKSALRVMNRFASENPNHRDTAQVAFLSARILKDMGQVKLAAQILQTIVTRYPNDIVVHDARILLASITR